MRECILIAAGDFSKGYFDKLMEISPRPYLIAVDGGFSYLDRLGIKPDLAVGDFDSLGFVPEGLEILKHPVRKDKTDMLLAIDRAIELGFDTAYVLGAMGGERFDHSFANMQTLFYSDLIHLIYLDDKSVSFALRNEELCLEKDRMEIRSEKGKISFDDGVTELVALKDRYISLFARNKAKVDISGFSYSGNDLELTDAFPLGASNEFTFEKGSILARGDVSVIISGKHN